MSNPEDFKNNIENHLHGTDAAFSHKTEGFLARARDLAFGPAQEGSAKAGISHDLALISGASKHLPGFELPDRKSAAPNGSDFNMTPSGQAALNNMRKLGVSDGDIMNGSFVKVSGSHADHGALYNEWKNMPGAQEAFSSHKGAAGVPEYRLPTGPGNACLLFGIGPNGNTFFQMERNNTTSLSQTLEHLKDYHTYKTTGRNVGPLGTSPYTDKHPIIA